MVINNKKVVWTINTEEKKMKEFRIGDSPFGIKEEIKKELIGGLKLSSCELMAKLKELETEGKVRTDTGEILELIR